MPSSRTNRLSITLSHRRRCWTSFSSAGSLTRILSPGWTLPANTVDLPSTGTKWAGVRVRTRPDSVVNRTNCRLSANERSRKAITSLYTMSPCESRAAIRSPSCTWSSRFEEPSAVRTKLLPGKQPPDFAADDDSERREWLIRKCEVFGKVSTKVFHKDFLLVTLLMLI